MRRAALLALVSGLGAAGPAEAYVRARTDSGGMVKYWEESCIPVTIYANGFDKDGRPDGWMKADEIVKSISAAAHAWSPDVVTCADGVSKPYLEIVPTLAPSGAKPPNAGVPADFHNSIIFRTDVWAKSGSPTAPGYAVEALAVTTVTANMEGKILDADIEINATKQVWSWINFDPGVSLPVSGGQTFDDAYYDLQMAITHEFGHLLGLEHTCFHPKKNDPLSNFSDDNKVRPQDDHMQLIPNCENAPGDVYRTVMFDQGVNLSSMPDLTKRTLSADEIRFLCDVYPESKDPHLCKLDNPNCAVAPAPVAGRPGRGVVGMAGFAALIAAAVVRGARARRARARA